ncbi:Nascent polypeptide-associated complex protein [Methanocaldococcus lauensis]|uniref:nascent polypeptide-associated complex protein n=1 Tax=Methanocaldococcus sp. TaxID=2152917 RepID=UPI001BEEEDD8|nr:nascent polypeptide-associated complex protein [Methanocaldococcus sp.]MCQ6254524.1 nascent polypeptide-associated complex protein [Methanocaldococcus sp.]CAB3289452.1 Nascent polypeptide-associated complex protein [Methanocaldococcus lauensis]
MFPGRVNPRMLKKMQKMMKDFGMETEDLNPKKVIFVFDDEEWVFDEPKVQVMDILGVKTYSITGKPKKVKKENIEEEEVKIEITEEDIELVANQCNVSKELAKKALEECNGDIAEAILKLEEEKN